MAIGEFYSVPEIDLRTATDAVFGSCVNAIRSMEKAAWVGEQWGDLAGKRPEELPPCFLAVQAKALSPRTGWTTEHGWWEPKELFTSPGLLRSWNDGVLYGTPCDFVDMWARTTLVFRPKDGSKTDLAMTLYTAINRNWNTRGGLTRLELEEDMALCRVFRVAKGKGKGIFHSEVDPLSFCQPQFGYAAHPVIELPTLDIAEFSVDDFSTLNFSDLDVLEFHNIDDEGNGVGGWDLPSIDSFGGPKKRPRSKPVGGSNVWGSFTKIYTKDPEIVYAGCHHCGRMMKLKGGSKCGTKSLSRHNETCPCKPGSSVDTLH